MSTSLYIRLALVGILSLSTLQIPCFAAKGSLMSKECYTKYLYSPSHLAYVIQDTYKLNSHNIVDCLLSPILIHLCDPY